jgi:propionyl-CoA carboxylase alpha chain
MNTRLQVEHPVTEMVTGLDLVEQMIRVAAGEKLRFKQSDVKLKGWAIEARVYAEDPVRNFLPAIGRLVRYREPSAGPAVRVDSGVYEGAEISMFYDPMIAKLVTYGEDRPAAISAMREALDSFLIRGLAHNISFLAALMAHPRFEAGRLTTGFIAEEFPDGFSGVHLPEEAMGDLVAVAAVVHQAYARRAVAGNPHFKTAAAVANGSWMVKIGAAQHPVTVVETAMGYAVIDGKRSRELVGDWSIGEIIYRGRIDGRSVVVQVDRDGIGYRLSHGGAQLKLQVLSPRAAALAGHMLEKVAPDMSKYLLSPMPGLLVSLVVQEGQEVKAGQELAVVEAMKMENLLRAERDAKVAKLHAKPGDSLSVDQVIVEFA